MTEGASKPLATSGSPLDLIPMDYAEAVGQVSLLWNMIEDSLAYLLGRYLRLGSESANALFGMLGNRARVDLLSFISEKEEKDSEMLDKVRHLVRCFNICRDNRNIVVHSSVRLSASLQPEDTVKRSGSSPGRFVSYGYDLGQITQVRRDMDNLLWFVSVLTATWFLNSIDEMETEIGVRAEAQPPLPLPDKPPLPRMLTPILRPSSAAPPPPQSSGE